MSSGKDRQSTSSWKKDQPSTSKSSTTRPKREEEKLFKKIDDQWKNYVSRLAPDSKGSTMSSVSKSSWKNDQPSSSRPLTKQDMEDRLKMFNDKWKKKAAALSSDSKETSKKSSFASKKK